MGIYQGYLSFAMILAIFALWMTLLDEKLPLKDRLQGVHIGKGGCQRREGRQQTADQRHGPDPAHLQELAQRRGSAPQESKSQDAYH